MNIFRLGSRPLSQTSKTLTQPEHPRLMYSVGWRSQQSVVNVLQETIEHCGANWSCSFLHLVTSYRYHHCFSYVGLRTSITPLCHPTHFQDYHHLCARNVCVFVCVCVVEREKKRKECVKESFPVPFLESTPRALAHNSSQQTSDHHSSSNLPAVSPALW